MAHRHLSEAQLAEFRGLLDARLADALAQRGRIDGSLADVRESRSDGMADDEHDPEGPTMSSEWSRLAGTYEAVDTELAAIQAARERLDGGSYGICVRCGESIPVERLRARPEAALCIACAQAVGA
ncbi:MAG: TraR/DksA family transcriptional regulator [Leifsonia sp.]